MTDALPPFDGAEVKLRRFALSGTIEAPTAQPAEPLHLGDEVVVLAVGTVTKVTHQQRDEGIVRVHAVRFAEAFTLDDGEAAVILDEKRKATADAIDRLLGRAQLPFDETS